MNHTHIFHYEGDHGTPEEGKFYGFLVDLSLEKKRKEEEARGNWWSHIYSMHRINGFSKEDLWEM